MINSKDREIPEKTLLVIPNRGIPNEEVAKLLSSLSDQKQRDWFNPHFYYCLPLIVANGYGFVVHAQKGFTAYWDGTSEPSGVSVIVEPPDTNGPVQFVSSHFGEGTITIQNFWHFRTPPGVNLMTITPPNMPQHGLMHMTGVVETDNLRRDFTFNLRITEPHVYVTVKAGDPIGAFIPIPRWYADQFSITYANQLYSEDEIELEHLSGDEFAKQRSGEDKNKPRQAGRLYFKGEDAWGNKFPNHQKH